MTTTYSRARGTVPYENGTELRGGPPIVRNAFGANGRADKNNHNNSSSTSATSISGSIGKTGDSSVNARLGSTAVNGGHSLAYTYAPLEHSSDSSWHQIPKSLATAVLGVDTADHVGGGGGGGGGAGGGAMSHQSKTYKMAVKRTVMSVALSCCFGLATMVFRGRQSGLEFFAGYLVEQSLSEYEYEYTYHTGTQRPYPYSHTLLLLLFRMLLLPLFLPLLIVLERKRWSYVCGGTFDCCPAAASTLAAGKAATDHRRRHSSSQ